MKKIIIVISILVLTGCSNFSIFSKEPKIFLEAADLGLAYTEDEALASSLYDGENLQITGVIKFIIEEKEETKIELFGGVICSITDEIESLTDLNLYNMVILNGKVDGLVEYNYVNIVSMDKCELVEVLTIPSIITTSDQIASLNLGEVGYEVVEITGVIYTIDQYFRYGFTLISDEEYNLPIEFEENFDFSALEPGDTVTVTGVVIPYISFLEPEGYKIYGYEIRDIVKED